MRAARDASLHPELVKDVIEELIAMDVISKNNIRKMKNEPVLYNPNTVMDLRHNQVKEFQEKRNTASLLYEEARRMIMKEEMDIISQQKQMDTIDKEIDNFKKQLDIERNKLIASNKLTNRDCRKMWLPYGQDPPPVIQVSTCPKSIVILKKEQALTETISHYQHENNKNLCLQASQIKMQDCPFNTLRRSKTVNDVKDVDSAHKNKLAYKMYASQPNVTCSKLNQNNDNTKSENCLKIINNKGNGVECKELTKQEESIKKACTKWKKFVLDRKLNEKVKHRYRKEARENKSLLRKSWVFWKDYLECAKLEKNCMTEKYKREEKINKFILALDERKRALVVNTFQPLLDCRNIENKSIKQIENNKEKTINLSEKIKCERKNSGSYANRFEAQKNIIESQKLKLNEQNKLIDEMKLAQLQFENEFRNKKVIEELKDSLESCDPKLKIKIKCIAAQLLARKDGNDASNVNSKLDFVRRMDERAQERRKRWEIIRKRKIFLEEEKLRKIEEEEETKRKENDNRKKQRIWEFKENKRKQRELELKQMEEKENMKHLMLMASEHYRRMLLSKVLAQMRKVVIATTLQELECDEHYFTRLLFNNFKAWRSMAQEHAHQLIELTEKIHNKCLLKKYFNKLWMYSWDCKRSTQVATDLFDMKLQERTFCRWYHFSIQQFMDLSKKMTDAEEYCNRKLLSYCFKNWKRGPHIAYIEREKEQRIRHWRDKVQEMLPDFQPILVEDY